MVGGVRLWHATGVVCGISESEEPEGEESLSEHEEESVSKRDSSVDALTQALLATTFGGLRAL